MAAGEILDKTDITPSSQSRIKFRSSPVKEDYIIHKTRMNLTKRWKEIVVNKDLEEVEKLQRDLDSEREQLEHKR